MKKIAIFAFLIIFFAVIAGCATLSVYAKVNPDTSISNYKVTIETTSMIYGMISGTLKSNFDESLYNYDEKWTGDKVIITVSAKNNIQSLDPANWTIKKVDNHIIYDDKRFASKSEIDTSNQYSAAMMNSVSLHYYLEMPGKITTSNANKVDGNKAEWHLIGNKMSTPIHAESELPLIPFISGFETVLALFGIMGALFVMKKK
jgi:hypothetical protein